MDSYSNSNTENKKKKTVLNKFKSIFKKKSKSNSQSTNANNFYPSNQKPNNNPNVRQITAQHFMPTSVNNSRTGNPVEIYDSTGKGKYGSSNNLPVTRNYQPATLSQFPQQNSQTNEQSPIAISIKFVSIIFGISTFVMTIFFIAFGFSFNAFSKIWPLFFFSVVPVLFLAFLKFKKVVFLPIHIFLILLYILVCLCIENMWASPLLILPSIGLVFLIFAIIFDIKFPRK